jgi:transcriptional regulator GlxA family with amidase domain
MVKTALSPKPRIEVGLVCDAGTSNTGLYGITDLFMYAGEAAAKHQTSDEGSRLRIAHWLLDEQRGEVDCTYDTHPGTPHAPSVLIIPGNKRAPFDAEKDSLLAPWLRLRHAEGAVLAAVCGGVFLLAKTGLLAGRQATTHWAFAENFATHFPEVLMESAHMVIDYGDVVTAGGALAWTDLGLRLIERFLGPTVMLETARYMLIDPPGREQRFYSDFEPKLKHGDPAILKAQSWLATVREQPVSVAQIAEMAGLELRTFARRFVKATGMKPSEYQQRLRITRAREMLEFSRTSVEQIAWTIGYTDVGGFRRIFRKVVGLTPSDYRRRFCRLITQNDRVLVQAEIDLD